MGTQLRDELLDLSDQAFDRLHGRIEDLGDEEYFWEPAPDCWTIRPTGAGGYRPDSSVMPPQPAPITTIAWRLAHITDILAQARNATWLGLEPVVGDDLTAEPTAAEAITRLARANAVWRQYLHAVSDETLWQPVGPVGRTFASRTRVAFVLHEIDELVHHGSEVALLRDLYRAAHTSGSEDPLVGAMLRADRRAVEQALSTDGSAAERVRRDHPALVARAAASGRWDAVRMLVELGFDVNARERRSALHDAAGAGNVDMVRYLVERGADTMAVDDDFRAAPLVWAQYFGHDDVIAFLEEAPQ
jgi:DinB superfamily/Ankyrin repeats (many copies)